MTQPAAGVAPAALTSAQAAAFAAGLRERDPEAADRFLRTPVPADAAAVVLEWLAANGLRELFPETLAITLDGGPGDEMLITRYRWKAGPRDTLDNVARRGGVEIVDNKRHPVRFPLTDSVTRAMFAAGVTFRRLDRPDALADDFERPVEPNPTTGRPAMWERHARLADLWLVPNGIAEWVPEQAVFVVEAGTRTITYDAYAYSEVPIVDHDGTLPGIGRGWGRNIMVRSDLDPTVQPADNAVIVAPRRVPLLVDLTAEVRALFAESELTLIER